MFRRRIQHQTKSFLKAKQRSQTTKKFEPKNIGSSVSRINPTGISQFCPNTNVIKIERKDTNLNVEMTLKKRQAPEKHSIGALRQKWI